MGVVIVAALTYMYFEDFACVLGQLGHMLCQAASQMAIKVMVLDPHENCPANALSYHHML